MKTPMSATAFSDNRTDSDTHNINARAETRSQLEADVAAFLNQGGNIEQVPRSYRADPPKKPENNYGRGSI